MITPTLPADDAEILLAWLQTQYIDKWFALPAGTPEPVLQAYRTAFSKAVQDPEFVRQAKLQFGEDFGATSAQNMTKLVHGMVQNAERVDRHMKAMREKHGLPAE
jgi:tripartite-type tricarboxylate transporter receptor subunit TctC